MSRGTIRFMDHLQDVLVSDLVGHWVHGFDFASRASVLGVSIKAPIVAMSQIVIRLVSKLMGVSWSTREPRRGTPALRAFSERLITVSCI